MLNNQLETFFKSLFNFNPNELIESNQLIPQLTETTHRIELPKEIVSSMIKGLPAPVKKHLEFSNIILTDFSGEYDFQETTEMLKDRIRSLYKAYNPFYEDEDEDKDNKFINGYFEKIQKDFNIEELRKNKDFSITKLKELLEKFTTYVKEDFLVALVNHAREGNNKPVVKYNDKKYKKFTENLRKKEIQSIGEAGRKSFVNIDVDGYFTAEIPLGLDENNRPYTQQSYQRDNGKLSNFVLHVMGYCDPTTGAVTILDQCTRAANYVPIDKKSLFEKLQGTLEQVEQRNVIEKQLDVKAEVATQISLLSPIKSFVAPLDTQHGLDPQHGYEQTLLTYLAFLMKNKDLTNGLELRYCVEGVNRFRWDIVSDPLKFQINTRFYNQLIKDALSQIGDYFQENKSGHHFDFIKLDTTKYDGEIAKSWKKVQIIINEINELMKEKKLQTNVLNEAIKQFQNALDQHHQYEQNLFDALMKNWKTNQESINGMLKVIPTETDISKHNALTELNNFYFLYERNHFYSPKRYLTPEYNYQLQSCVHRLSANLGHKVRINCNDSEDRTGVENVVTFANLKYQHQNKNHIAPDLTKQETLKKVQILARNQQSKDVGINNTTCNGSTGMQVSSGDVAADLVNKEGVENAKLTKDVYAFVKEEESVWFRFKRFVPQLFKNFGNYIIQKIVGKPACGKNATDKDKNTDLPNVTNHSDRATKSVTKLSTTALIISSFVGLGGLVGLASIITTAQANNVNTTMIQQASNSSNSGVNNSPNNPSPVKENKENKDEVISSESTNTSIPTGFGSNTFTPPEDKQNDTENSDRNDEAVIPTSDRTINSTTNQEEKLSDAYLDENFQKWKKQKSSQGYKIGNFSDLTSSLKKDFYIFSSRSSSKSASPPSSVGREFFMPDILETPSFRNS